MPEFGNTGGGLAGVMSGAGGLGRMLGRNKNKGGAQDMGNVPMAEGSFYQPMQSDARSQLLQTMMQRSRAGRGGM